MQIECFRPAHPASCCIIHYAEMSCYWRKMVMVLLFLYQALIFFSPSSLDPMPAWVFISSPHYHSPGSDNGQATYPVLYHRLQVGFVLQKGHLHLPSTFPHKLCKILYKLCTQFCCVCSIVVTSSEFVVLSVLLNWSTFRGLLHGSTGLPLR